MTVKPVEIINAFYEPGADAYEVLLRHSTAVARKALQIARRVAHLKPDLRFIEEAAMLHDIGIFLTHAPSIGCTGKYPYVCHGYLGRELLEKRGLASHALVCERHVGVGLSADDIRKNRLPVPARDAVPVTVEEQIICYADKFFSKKTGLNVREDSVDAVLENLGKYGPDKVQRFCSWIELFEKPATADVK